MNAWNFVMAAAMAVLLLGCASPSERQIWSGAPASLRGRLGVVGVVIETNSRAFTYDIPLTRGEAARDMSGLAISGNLLAAAHSDRAGGLVLLGLPVAAVGGVIYGAVAGLNKSELQRTLTAITNTTAKIDLRDNFLELVKHEAGKHGFPLRDALDRDEAIHHVLQLRVVRQELSTPSETPNPGLSLHLLIHARLIDSAGQVVYDTYFERRGSRQSFATWAADDARRFRSEWREMQEKAASTILERIFLGEDSE
jgi:hypothetical protein